MKTTLYTPAILRLAASIPHEGRLRDAAGSAERRSPVCGSRIVVDVTIGGDGRIAALGQEVHACAFGQASAALLGAHALGRSAAQVAAAREQLAGFLAGRLDSPGDWPGLDVFAPARGHASRHAAILLAFEAAAAATAAAVASRKDAA